MKRFFVIMLGLCLLMGVMLPGAALADDADGGQGSPKDVYIDNTVDNSVSYVTGVIITTDEATGETRSETVYSESASVTYSNPKTAQVQGMINDAYTAVYTQAEATGYEFQMSTGESTGKVWDNRKYTTVEDDDAVLIGDADYLQGAYGVNGEYTRTHIASGDYGKETFYRVEAAVTKPAEESPAAYGITASTADGGTVTVSGETAAEGSTVTVTAQADAGWVLETLGVFSVTGHHQISATVYGDSGMTEDSVTFTMPADDVEISATFVKPDQTEPAETPQTEPADDPAPAAPAAAPASPAPAALRPGGRQSPQTGYGDTGAFWAAALLFAGAGAGLLWMGRRKTHK